MEKAENLIRQRPLDSYTSKEDDEMHLISIKDIDFLPPSNDIAVPFGSASYIIQKYPGDLDLVQQMVGETDIPKFIRDVAREMKRTVSDIVGTKCHIVSDIKAGIDKEFDIKAIELKDGCLVVYPIELEKIFEKIKQKDYFAIVQILDSELPDSNKYDGIDIILREYKIVRWSPKQLINGKQTKNGKSITLERALMDKTHVKIDEITYLDEKFVEVTNIMYLATRPNGGEIQLVNTSFDFTDRTQLIISYDQSIKKEVEKLFYSNVWFSPFKGAKRMWAYSRVHIDDPALANYLVLLTPIVTGDISALYQIKSEIGTIDLALSLKNVGQIHKCIQRHLKSRLQAWKTTISHVLILPEVTQQQLLGIINSDCLPVRKIVNLEKALKVIINKLAMAALQEAHLYPIPNQYLPTQRMYRKMSY